MGNRSGSGSRRRASGGDCGEAGSSKRLRWVADKEEQQEDEAEGVGDDAGAVDGEDLCFACKDGGELRVCDFRFVS
jgi:hypothetical protein